MSGLYDDVVKNASLKILWQVDPLLGNARNIHAANNTGVVFSVVRARTVAMEREQFTRAR
jgi:3-deoxy-D-arabino-heptulosonate 7-phosphate (DAHP) synthase class II